MSVQNFRMPPDELLVTIADYVLDETLPSALAYRTAQTALLDSLGCAIRALKAPKCLALLGPYVPGTKVPLGVRVPGTHFELDPIKAAFDIGSCIRWLDYNDTWLAAEWGHPSDNLGGILAVSDYLGRLNGALGHVAPRLKDVWEVMIKAYEIQGILALNHAFNQKGLDHVILVKVATTAAVAKLLGFSKTKIIAALSHAWIDGASLRTYRHAPNTVARKSWAAGDATRRGVELAWLVDKGEEGAPSALSAKQWGFYDVLWDGQPIQLSRPFGNYVMENILFKVKYPAEFHAQTAIECALQLRTKIKDKIASIQKIVIHTQSSAFKIIHKEGPLYNEADRDHCLQYMVAVALLFGELKAEHYSDHFANDKRIDELRSKMTIKESSSYSQDYYDPEKRSIANAIQIFFQDGSQTEEVENHYPLGHRKRRQEAESALKIKYMEAVKSHYELKQSEQLCGFWDNIENLGDCNLSEFMASWVKL